MGEDYLKILTNLPISTNFNAFSHGEIGLKHENKSEIYKLKDKLSNVIMNTLFKFSKKKMLDENSIYYHLFGTKQKLNEKMRKSIKIVWNNQIELIEIYNLPLFLFKSIKKKSQRRNGNIKNAPPQDNQKKMEYRSFGKSSRQFNKTKIRHLRKMFKKRVFWYYLYIYSTLEWSLKKIRIDNFI